MKKANCLVLFRGELSDGIVDQQVYHGLRTIFGLKNDEINKIFSQDSVIIKKNIDRDIAEKLTAKFAKIGMLCEIIEDSEKDPSTTDLKTHSPKMATKASVCPKCGHDISYDATNIMDGHGECSYCGIIISKFKEAKTLSEKRKSQENSGSDIEVEPLKKKPPLSIGVRIKRALITGVCVFLLIVLPFLYHVAKKEEKHYDDFLKWSSTFAEQFNPEKWDKIDLGLQSLKMAHKGKVYIIYSDNSKNFNPENENTRLPAGAKARSVKDVDVIIWKVVDERMQVGRVFGRRERIIVRALWPRKKQYAEYELLSEMPDWRITWEPGQYLNKKGTFDPKVDFMAFVNNFIR